ncbi:ileal sodium/bile acid cotransporter isoform X2 [Coccinella septempunctata]|uniref:ileal sodium/bile acid cotransporter isoform X2 n=1 Tax=Coccinella septempunctata TaxID=41139 RepID=UPI001D08EE36|nr:ileal sodium/bile acid cotransporter isoform X2 [Coccinella septempunctata]
MCPFNGLTQILLLILAIILINTVVINALSIKFENESVTVHMDETISVPYTILKDTADEYEDDGTYLLQLKSNDGNIATIDQEIYVTYNELPKYASMNVTGVFLGKTSVSCRNVKKNKTLDGALDVIVIRKHRLIDTIFTVSVATLVSIIYINFGCFLNWGELKRNLKRPVGPVIGLCSQFIFMPLLSYGLGRVLFPESPEMQLGMFFTGVAPSGGASNIWTLVLDGNVDLSITVTSLGNFVALLMMPLWIFSLGKLIFNQAKLVVPYRHIATSAFGLIIPLAIGYLLTRYCKNLASFLARILKGLSSLLLLFIIVFATVTNLYLFKIFSWKIVVAGMALPYLGFTAAFILSKILRQADPDCLAIAIETGIQNTGIAIFLLRFSLTQPAADLTTVCPVAVSMMTPIPLVGIYIYKKIQASKYISGYEALPST